jgi:uncharacterized protein (TIGR03437 family)
MEIPVTLVVDDSPPTASLSQDSFALQLPYGNGAEWLSFTVTNSGTRKLDLQYRAKEGAWLTTQGSLSLDAHRTTAIVFRVACGGLEPGAYSDTIEFFSPDGTVAATVTVLLSVKIVGPVVSLSTDWLSFETREGGPPPKPQKFLVWNSGSGTLHWTATPMSLDGYGGRIHVSLTEGTAASGAPFQEAEVTVDTTDLSSNFYSGLIKFKNGDRVEKTISIGLTVLPPDAPIFPSITPLGVVLTPGSSAPVTVSYEGASPLDYKVDAWTDDGLGWLSVSPARGVLNPGGDVILTPTVNPAGLSPGIRRGMFRIGFGNGRSWVVTVLFVIPQAAAATEERKATAACVPNMLAPLFVSIGPDFTLAAGKPVNVRAVVIDDCAQWVTDGNLSLSWNNVPAATLQPIAQGVWQGTWIPEAATNPENLVLTAHKDSLSGQAQLQGLVSVEGGVVPPRILSVVNSASFAPANQIAPNSWISIFGEGLADGSAAGSGSLGTTLGKSQVLLGDKLLILLYASPSMINVLAPADLQPGSVQTLTVVRDGVISAPANVAVGSQTPAVFMLGQPTGQAAAQIAGTADIAAPVGTYPGSRPVRRGEYLTLYLTGLGATTVTPDYGVPAPVTVPLAITVAEPKVTIGGIPVPVSFSGLTPGTLGLYQINVQVPQNAPVGAGVTILVESGGRQAPAVKVAIE